MANVVPGAYRQVSVADVDVPLTEPAPAPALPRPGVLPADPLRRRRATRGAHALVEVELADAAPLFSPGGRR